MRGLAASARIQGQYKSAIKHLERVLEISQEFKEFTGARLSGTACAEWGAVMQIVCFMDKRSSMPNSSGHSVTSSGVLCTRMLHLRSHMLLASFSQSQAMQTPMELLLIAIRTWATLTRQQPTTTNI
eukprot:608984-Pelagomonas_calceolata.AAC.1